MRRYLDTSLLVAVLIREAGTAAQNPIWRHAAIGHS